MRKLYIDVGNINIDVLMSGGQVMERMVSIVH